MDRRTLLKGAVAGAGLTFLGSATARAAGTRRPRTPIDHTVVLMMENRSVDHYLGWYGRENRAFDGRQRMTYRDAAGHKIGTADWGGGGRGDFHGRGFVDPGHGWESGRVQRNGGRADGWLLPGSGPEGGSNDEFALSYYGADDIPVWAQLVREFTTFDRYFCSLLGPTYPNRYYMHSATASGLKDNSFPPELVAQNPAWAAGFDWPTIWTLCEAAGVTWTYYYSNLPVVALWGARHLRNARHISDYYADAEAGTLPQVAFVDPWFVQPEGLANDDHPHADLRLGQELIADVVGAFVESPNFLDGALFLTYDEWGGFWDHVPPPRIADARASADPDEDFAQLGFRVPTVVVSPYTRGGRVDHTVYEHSSILRFVTENYGLPYLSTRHRSTTSIERAFDGFRTFRPEVELVRFRADPTVRIEPAVEAVPVASDLWPLLERGWFDTFRFRTDFRFEDSLRR